MLNNGVKVINNSWGTDGGAVGVEAYNEVARAYHDAAPDKRNLTILGQYKKVVDRGALLVFPTGNERKTQPLASALYPLAEPELQKGMLAVAGVDENGNIAVTGPTTGSNHCGSAAQWCLAASYSVDMPVKGGRLYVDPVYGYVLEEPETMIKTMIGTSFAAPMVTGAAALVQQKYPWMNNDNLRTTLLTTAQDLGAKGVDSVYGWGLLNIGKAVNGPAQFAFGDFRANVDAGASTFSNDISGTGGLVKAGNGSLTLQGNNSYTGKTVVEGGALVVNASTASSPALVMLSGTLRLGANAAVGTTTNLGTLQLTDGHATVNGDYSQLSTATMYSNIGNVLTVKGKADLGGRLKLDNTGKYATANGVRVNVLTAAAGVNGMFDKVESGALIASVNNLQKNEKGEVSYLVQRQNATKAAGAITTTDLGADGYRGSVNQAGENVEAAFTELDGLSEAQLANSKFAHAASHLQSESSYQSLGSSLKSLSAATYANSAAVYAMEQGKHWSLLGDNLNLGKAGESSAIATYTHSDTSWSHQGLTGSENANGALIGGTTAVSDGVTVGAAYSHNSSNWGEGNGDSAKTDANGLVVGAAYGLGENTYLKGMLSYSRYNSKFNRALLVAGEAEKLQSEVSGNLWQLGLLGGKYWNLSNAWLFNLEGGLRYDYLKQQAFRENSSNGFGWAGSKTGEATPVGLLSAKAQYKLNPAVALYAKAALEQDLKRRDYAVAGKFEGADAATGKTGSWEMPRTRGSASVGLLADVGKAWSVNGEYRFTGSSHYRNHAANVGVKYRF